jgi:hypothetical protein
MAKNDHIQGILFDQVHRLRLDEYGDPSIKAKVAKLSKRVREARQTTKQRILTYYPIPVVEHRGFLSDDQVSEIFNRLRFAHPIHHNLIEAEYAPALAYPRSTSRSINQDYYKNRRLF